MVRPYLPSPDIEHDVGLSLEDETRLCTFRLFENGVAVRSTTFTELPPATRTRSPFVLYEINPIEDVDCDAEVEGIAKQLLLPEISDELKLLFEVVKQRITK